MNADEAVAVAAVAAQCLTWSGWRRWEPVMRYVRLFTLLDPAADIAPDLGRDIPSLVTTSHGTG
jgi:hypothetical protein